MALDETQAVEECRNALAAALSAQYVVRVGACLLYHVRVNEKLEIIANPKRPVRGRGAFQTDLCVFESRPEAVLLPRVVLEFKLGVTTHDVLTYNVKAEAHKRVYPYLRYGLVSRRATKVPDKFFWHGGALDFFIGLEAFKETWLSAGLLPLVQQEVEASKLHEAIAFGRVSVPSMRRETVLGASVLDSRVTKG